MTPGWTPPLTPLTAMRDNLMPIDALGERIAELTAWIDAATDELLDGCLREIHEGCGWSMGGSSSALYCSNRRTGITGPVRAQKVRWRGRCWGCPDQRRDGAADLHAKAPADHAR